MWLPPSCRLPPGIATVGSSRSDETTSVWQHPGTPPGPWCGPTVFTSLTVSRSKCSMWISLESASESIRRRGIGEPPADRIVGFVLFFVLIFGCVIEGSYLRQSWVGKCTSDG